MLLQDCKIFRARKLYRRVNDEPHDSTRITILRQEDFQNWSDSSKVVCQADFHFANATANTVTKHEDVQGRSVVCGLEARIIQDVPNLSLTIPKRNAKKVSSIAMNMSPPSESNV